MFIFSHLHNRRNTLPDSLFREGRFVYLSGDDTNAKNQGPEEENDENVMDFSSKIGKMQSIHKVQELNKKIQGLSAEYSMWSNAIKTLMVEDQKGNQCKVTRAEAMRQRDKILNKQKSLRANAETLRTEYSTFAIPLLQVGDVPLHNFRSYIERHLKIGIEDEDWSTRKRNEAVHLLHDFHIDGKLSTILLQDEEFNEEEVDEQNNILRTRNVLLENISDAYKEWSTNESSENEQKLRDAILQAQSEAEARSLKQLVPKQMQKYVMQNAYYKDKVLAAYVDLLNKKLSKDGREYYTRDWQAVFDRMFQLIDSGKITYKYVQALIWNPDRIVGRAEQNVPEGKTKPKDLGNSSDNQALDAFLGIIDKVGPKRGQRLKQYFERGADRSELPETLSQLVGIMQQPAAKEIKQVRLDITKNYVFDTYWESLGFIDPRDTATVLRLAPDVCDEFSKKALKIEKDQKNPEEGKSKIQKLWIKTYNSLALSTIDKLKYSDKTKTAQIKEWEKSKNEDLKSGEMMAMQTLARFLKLAQDLPDEIDEEYEISDEMQDAFEDALLSDSESEILKKLESLSEEVDEDDHPMLAADINEAIGQVKSKLAAPKSQAAGRHMHAAIHSIKNYLSPERQHKLEKKANKRWTGKIVKKEHEDSEINKQMSQGFSAFEIKRCGAELTRDKASWERLAFICDNLSGAGITECVSGKEFEERAQGETERFAFHQKDPKNPRSGKIVINDDDPLRLYIIECISAKASNKKSFPKPSNTLFQKYSAIKNGDNAHVAKQALELYWSTVLHELKHHEFEFNKDSLIAEVRDDTGKIKAKYGSIFTRAEKHWPSKDFRDENNNLTDEGIEKIMSELHANAAEMERGKVKLDPPESEDTIMKWICATNPGSPILKKKPVKLDIAGATGVGGINVDEGEGVVPSDVPPPDMGGGVEGEGSIGGEGGGIGGEEGGGVGGEGDEIEYVERKEHKDVVTAWRLKDKIESVKNNDLPLLNKYLSLQPEGVSDIDRQQHEGNIGAVKHAENYVSELESMFDQIDDDRARLEAFQKLESIEKEAIQVADYVEGIEKGVSINIFTDMWQNTVWLSTFDIGQMYEKIVEWGKRRYTRMSNDKIGKVGQELFKHIPRFEGLAQEFTQVSQQNENEEVENYKKAFEQYGLDELFEEVQKPQNRDSLKAAIQQLVELGNFQEILKWDKVKNVLQHYSHQPVYNTETALDAIDEIWGKNTATGWMTSDTSNFMSEKSKAQEHGDAIGPGGTLAKYKLWLEQCEAANGDRGRMPNFTEMLGVMWQDLLKGTTHGHEVLPYVQEIIFLGGLPEHAVNKLITDLQNDAPVFTLWDIKSAEGIGLYQAWKKKPNGREDLRAFMSGEKLLFLNYDPHTTNEIKATPSKQEYWVSIYDIQATRKSGGNRTSSDLAKYDQEHMEYIFPGASRQQLTQMLTPSDSGELAINNKKIAGGVTGILRYMRSCILAGDETPPIGAQEQNLKLKQQLMNLLLVIEYCKRCSARKDPRYVQQNVDLKSEFEIDLRYRPGGPRAEYENFIRDRGRSVIDANYNFSKANEPAWNQKVIIEKSMVSWAKTVENLFADRGIDLPLASIVEDDSLDSPFNHFAEFMAKIDEFTDLRLGGSRGRLAG